MDSNNTNNTSITHQPDNGSPAPASGAATVPLVAAAFKPTPVELEWVDLFQKGFVGDILACISIALAITSTPDADGTDVSFEFGI